MVGKWVPSCRARGGGREGFLRGSLSDESEADEEGEVGEKIDRAEVVGGFGFRVEAEEAQACLSDRRRFRLGGCGDTGVELFRIMVLSEVSESSGELGVVEVSAAGIVRGVDPVGVVVVVIRVVVEVVVMVVVHVEVVVVVVVVGVPEYIASKPYVVAGTKRETVSEESSLSGGSVSISVGPAIRRCCRRLSHGYSPNTTGNTDKQHRQAVGRSVTGIFSQ